MPSRRRFLSSLAGATGGSLLSPLLAPLESVMAEEPAVTPDLVRFTPDIEPLVRLIEETPREKCFEVISERLRAGVPYRQFVAALFLAGIRNVNPQPPGFKFHCVFVIHAAHELSLEVAAEDRLLPMFWALDNFKIAQQQDVEQGDFQLKPLSGKLPSAEQAWDELSEAMRDWDEERADRAIAVLVRSVGAHRLIERMWRYGARDYRNIGHKAIFVANTWRTLQTIGWRHAEPAFRSLALGLLDFGRSERVNDYTFTDQSFISNARRVAQTATKLPGDWTVRQEAPDAAPTLGLLDVIRTGQAGEAADEAVSLLMQSRARADQLWDAVHLAAGELMMQQPGIYGIHTVTSSSALRYAYEMSSSEATRLLMLLQGIGWMCQFRNFMRAKPQGLKSFQITDLKAREGSEDPPPVDHIFEMVGRDAPAAADAAFVYGTRTPSATPFVASARNLLLAKAADAHDFKYSSAVFEDYRRVSPAWRPHLLATAVYYLRGSGASDSPVMQRAAAALSHSKQ